MGFATLFSKVLRPLLEPAKKPESALSLLERQLELLKNLDSALLEINKAKEQIQRESGDLHNRLASLSFVALILLTRGHNKYLQTYDRGDSLR